jgi:SnoaL-like polyketide cyclase
VRPGVSTSEAPPGQPWLMVAFAGNDLAGPGDLSEASRQLLEQSFTEGNFELIDRLVAAEAVNHDPATPARMRHMRGPEVLKRMATMYRTAFPDLRITVHDVIAADDKVVLRWHSEGTQRPRGGFAVGRRSGQTSAPPRCELSPLTR